MDPFVPHGKTAHFKVKRSPEQLKFNLDICKYLTYGASCPSRPNRPTFKVRRSPDQASIKTLPMERLALRGQKRPILGQAIHGRVNLPFYRFSCAIVHGIFGDPKFLPHFAKTLLGRPLRPYLWSQLALTGKTAYLLGQTIPGAVQGLIGDPEFRPHFSQNFTGRPLRPYLWSQLALTAKMAHFKGQTIPEAGKPLICRTSVKTLPVKPVGPHGQNSPFLRSNDPRSSWPSRPKRPILKVKRSPKQTSVKTLPLEPVGPHSQNGLFSRSNDSQSKPYLYNQLTLTAKSVHFQGQTIPEADLTCGASRPSRPKWPILKVKRSPEQENPYFANFHLTYGSSWPSRPTRPILKVKRSPEPSVDFLVIQNFDLFFGKILPGLRYKPTYEAINGIFGDPKFRSHFFQNFTWTSVKTLPMEPVGPHGQNDPFLRSNNPQSRQTPILPIFMGYKFQPHFCQNVTYTFVNTLPMEPVGPHGQNIPFLRSKIPGAVYGFFGNLELRSYFCQNFTWRSVKTLPMEPFDPHDQTGPFSGSNEPRSRRPLRPYLWSQLALMDKTAHFQGQTISEAVNGIFGDPDFQSNFCQNITCKSVKTLFIEPVGTYGQNGPFSWSNDPQSKASWPSRPKRPIFKVKRSLEKSVKTLPMEPVDPHGQNGPFSRSNDPRSSQLALIAKTTHFQGQTIPGVVPYLWSQLALTTETAHFQDQTITKSDKPPFYQFSCAVVHRIFGDPEFRPHFCQNFTWMTVSTSPMEPVSPHVQNGPFSYLTFGASWTSWPKCPIFKVKRSLEQINPQICQFSYAIVNGILVIHNFDPIFAKILPRHPLRPYLWSQLALTAKSAHFLGQTFPGADFINEASWPSRPKEIIVKVKGCSVQDLTYGAKWPSRPKRPIFKVKRTGRKTLPMEPVGPHGQNDPKVKGSRANLTYGASWPSRPKWPILKVKHSPEQSMEFLVIQNSDLIFAKNFTWMTVSTLPMEPVSPHGQNVNGILVIQNSDPIFAKILPRHPSRPYLWSQLALTAKTAHFLGQTFPGADFINEASWPSQPKEIIFKVKGCPVQDLTYGAKWPSRPKRPIFKVKRTPEQSKDFLVIQNSDLIFPKISPGRPLRPYLWSQLALTAKMTHFKGQRIPGADLTYGASWPSRPKRPILKVKHSSEQSMDFLVIQNSNLFFAKILPGLRYKPTYGASWPSRLKRPIFKVKRSSDQLALTAKTTHFQGQTISEVVHEIFGDPEFRPFFAKTLPGRPLGPYLWSQLALTAKSNYPQRSWPSRPKRPILKVKLFPEQPSQRKQPIFMVKRSSEQSMDFLEISNFDHIFAKILPGGPLRPYIWSQLTLTAKTAHFQGQTNLRVDLTYGASWHSRPKRPIFKHSNLIFAKILPGYPLIPYLWSQLALTAKTAHFQGQTIPGAGKPPFCQCSCPIVHGFFGDPKL
ncbi:hypothetical protein H5410_058871 [Solanum commersonii]|uniref:Uncharacterized protein n=1 Tax=Solanum commersonii TaxID=4109 RepID=A0A9J5W111_SOLCO|nr:hypothetical protein H5410_058871 [Solanum commersonii]